MILEGSKEAARLFSSPEFPGVYLNHYGVAFKDASPPGSGWVCGYLFASLEETQAIIDSARASGWRLKP